MLALLPAEELSVDEFRVVRPLGMSGNFHAKVWPPDNRFVWIKGNFFNLDAAKALRDWLNEVIPPQSDAATDSPK